MPDTIEGVWNGTTFTMRVGDKVGLLWTGRGYIDTFSGTEVEIMAIHQNGIMTVRTYNGIELDLGRLEVAPALKKPGRKPVPRADGEKIVATSITLPESDIAYLATFNPKNLSDAIRKLIAAHRS